MQDLDSAKSCSGFIYPYNKTKAELGRIPATCDISKRFIVMSRGRGGSEYEMQVVSRVLNSNIKVHGLGPKDEILGQNAVVMIKLLNPLSTIQNYFCSANKNEYIGFKWKPDIWNEAFATALHWVAENEIPILFSVRNPIDIVLSSLKHRDYFPSSDINTKMPSHCGKYKTKCLERQKAAQLVEVPIPFLLERLHEFTCLGNYVRSLLDRVGARYIDVEYEKLSYEHSDEKTFLRTWREIFEFLDPGRPWHSTINMELLNASATIYATSSPSHRDKIHNYEEVETSLRGTPFARLLN